MIAHEDRWYHHIVSGHLDFLKASGFRATLESFCRSQLLIVYLLLLVRPPFIEICGEPYYEVHEGWACVHFRVWSHALSIQPGT